MHRECTRQERQDLSIVPRIRIQSRDFAQSAFSVNLPFYSRRSPCGRQTCWDKRVRADSTVLAHLGSRHAGRHITTTKAR